MMPNIFRDSSPLPSQTESRYCMFYWEECGFPVWQTMPPDPPVRKGTPVTIKGIDRAKFRKFLKTLGYEAWNRERAEEYLEDKRLAEAEKRKARRQERVAANPKRRTRTLEEIYYETMARAGREIPKPKPAKPPAPLPQPFDVEARSDVGDFGPEDGPAVIARRARQKAVLDSGRKYFLSSPGSGVVRWQDESITDIALVRLVLGPVHGNRDMTPEEQADYWYWKARGK